MKDIQPSTLSEKKYTYNILDSIEVEIKVTNNPYNLPINELFTMAARINKKRSFLFVSKLLGKHLPIDPNKGLLTGALLAVRFAEVVKIWNYQEKERLIGTFLSGKGFEVKPFIPEDINPVVIGFAETATALGHSFFNYFQSADFFHTTRELLHNKRPIVTFEEEHSHATSHRCYIPVEMIQNDREIILVDDEITTGKTALNIIQSIHQSFPRKEYTVVSILDWRSEENKLRFHHLEEKLGIKINVVSLLSGDVKVTEKNRQKQPDNKQIQTRKFPSKVELLELNSYFTSTDFFPNDESTAPYIKETGRFGLDSRESDALLNKITDASLFLKGKRTGKNTLCIGTGEFMYLPMRLSQGLGEGVSYQSTTRSPIYIHNYEGYGARFGVSFPAPENTDILNSVYNIPPGTYDELFIFLEREVRQEHLQLMLEQFEALAIPSIKVVFTSKNRGV